MPRCHVHIAATAWVPYNAVAARHLQHKHQGQPAIAPQCAHAPNLPLCCHSRRTGRLCAAHSAGTELAAPRGYWYACPAGQLSVCCTCMCHGRAVLRLVLYETPLFSSYYSFLGLYSTSHARGRICSQCCTRACALKRWHEVCVIVLVVHVRRYQPMLPEPHGQYLGSTSELDNRCIL